MCVKAKVIDPFRAAAQKEFLVTTKNAFLPVKRVYSINTYINEFQLSHEGESIVSEQACEWSE